MHLVLCSFQFKSHFRASPTTELVFSFHFFRYRISKATWIRSCSYSLAWLFWAKMISTNNDVCRKTLEDGLRDDSRCQRARLAANVISVALTTNYPFTGVRILAHTPSPPPPFNRIQTILLLNKCFVPKTEMKYVRRVKCYVSCARTCPIHPYMNVPH